MLRRDNEQRTWRTRLGDHTEKGTAVRDLILRTTVLTTKLGCLRTLKGGAMTPLWGGVEPKASPEERINLTGFEH